jgi:chromosome segregation ATPase
MNRVAVGLLAAGLLGAVACEEQTPNNSGAGTTPPGQADRTGAGTGLNGAQEAQQRQQQQDQQNGTLGGVADAAKQQAVQQFNQQLDGARQQIDELRAKESQVPADQKEAYESGMQQVQSSYANLTGLIDRMRNASGDQWREIQSQFTSGMTELNQHIQRVKSMLSGAGGQQPSSPPSSAGG